MLVSELRFVVLGPVRAWRGGAELDLGTPQQRAVLAVLLLAEGRQVPASALVDALWGDEPPKAATGAVRTYISQLRRCLRTGGGPEVIESAGNGYALPLPPSAVDLGMFLRWTGQARTARSAGHAAQAAMYLRDALGLWTGAPLAGLPGEYAETQRTRLTELHLAAVEDRLALDIELDRHVAAAAELRTLLAAHPLRERLSELLMLALYRAGRQADALAVFGATRRVLGEELGIDPGPALQDIHRRILQTDESLTSAAAAPPPRGDRDPRRLPVDMTSLLGRERAIEEVAGLVGHAGARLVTLTGPGGVGKTRLGVAVGERLAGRFGAGTVFVPLEAVTDPGLVLAAVGRATGVDLSRTVAPLEVLAETFGDGAWLLIVDNVEQVIRAARDLGELLARCPGMVIVATSRTVLGVRGEREYPVPPLPVPAAAMPSEELAACPAVALFVDRARAVRPGFALTEGNAATVAEICARVEGLPLAIELAAARTRLLDPAALLTRLAASLDALGTGAVDLPERQRTLRATVEWSVGLLEDAERSLLETAAVFAGGWTLQAAAQVAGLDEERALELSEALARHSLVHVGSTRSGPRFRMLETVREYMAERLAARPDSTEIAGRHAEYYRALADQADRPLRGAGQNKWLKQLQAEGGNLVAAVRWYMAHDRRPLPHLFRVLWLFWAWGDFKDEAQSWVAQLLPDAGTLDPQARAELTWAASAIALFIGDDTTALVAFERLEPLLPWIADPYLRAVSRLVMGLSLPIVGDLDGAVRQVLVSLEELRGQDEPFWTFIAGFGAGSMEIALGRYDDAARHAALVRDFVTERGGKWFDTGGSVHLAILNARQGRLEEARPLLAKALVLSLTIRSPTFVALCLAGYAQLASAEGDLERAALLEGAAEGLRQRVGISAWAFLRPMEAGLVASVREQLGEDRFDRAFRDGAGLTQREAVAVVRRVDKTLTKC